MRVLEVVEKQKKTIKIKYISIETGLLIRTLQKWVKVSVDIVFSFLISFSQVGVDHQTISLLWSARAAGKKCHTGCGVGIIYTLKIIC